MTRTLVRKTCDILIALRDGPMTRQQLVLRVKLPKSSLHWMLNDLCDMGLVDQTSPPRKSGRGMSPFVFELAYDWKPIPVRLRPENRRED